MIFPIFFGIEPIQSLVFASLFGVFLGLLISFLRTNIFTPVSFNN